MGRGWVVRRDALMFMESPACRRKGRLDVHISLFARCVATIRSGFFDGLKAIHCVVKFKSDQ